MSLKRSLLLLLFLSATPVFGQTARAPYVPPAGAWEHRTPEQVGLKAANVKAAVDFAIASESTTPKNLIEAHLRSFGREPHGEAVGPFRDRGPATGIIIKGGYIVAEWGEPDRVDVTFSVTKSFVSTTIGLAYDRGMITDLNRPVHEMMPPIVALAGTPGGVVAPGVVIPSSGIATAERGVAFHAFEVLDLFNSEHNRRITWDHLLRQTSDWQGTLWGKPDWSDRPRGDTVAWKTRARGEPGIAFQYNDVRVNLMALASLNVWRRPLPQVLREYVMDPIGASHTWRWYGYDNSWIILDGELVQSVAGGAHWGGGMFISARDMARFGLLTQRRGKWGTKQILSDKWITLATTPGVNKNYGFSNFYLNTGRTQLPTAPEKAFFHLGNGNNIIYVDPVNDLVIVARWISTMGAMDGVLKRLLEGEPAK
jgi:CubicO group peptidase (beta-lactamase class C family)